jgi:hypothetical protein
VQFDLFEVMTRAVCLQKTFNTLLCVLREDTQNPSFGVLIPKSAENSIIKTLLIDSQFTAKIELNLDAIALGDKSWQPYLCESNKTYFSLALAQAKLQIPESTNSKAKGTITLTEYLCPVCKKQLERYDYTKGKHEKYLLRCSHPEARKKSNHQNAIFFLTRQNNWWNKDFILVNDRTADSLR